MIDPVSIGLAIAISLASSKIEKSLKKLNVYHCSKKVLDEIDESFDDANDSWSKNQGAIDAKRIDHLKIIRNLTDKTNNNLTDEDKIFLECFKYAIAKRENAWRYLTTEMLEVRFIEILQLQDTQHSSLSKGQKDIITKLDSIERSIGGYVEVKFDKSDARQKSKYFISFTSEQLGYTIERYLREENDYNASEKYLFNEKRTESTLNTLLRKKAESFVILKGLPGSGKSIELKKLALDLWEDAECDLIPFYRDLRNFTVSDDMESFFDLKNISQYVNVVFILDGLDEIKDENYFISKFNSYLRNNKNLSQRFVLSCRSSVIEKHKKDFLDTFNIFELEDLSVEQAKNLLKEKTGVEFDNKILERFKESSSFLNDPFKLNIVAEYYKKLLVLETNPVKLWETYFKSILENDQYDKLKKKELAYNNLKYDCKLIAFVLESTKEMNIPAEDIFKILNKEEVRVETLINCAIIFSNNNLYEFEHKQLQEYLAGLLISSFDSDKIIKIFQIERVNSIKPSLVNTLALLIGILENEKEKQSEIFNFILKNEPELLFNVDSSSVPNFQVHAFQLFFQHKCIETTLWIGNSTSVSLDKLAKFADCEINFEYLINIALNKNEHFRVRTSAIEILANFKPRLDNETKEKLFNLLKKNTKGGYKNINSSVLQLFIEWNLRNKFNSLIIDIIELFGEDDHTAHTTKILKLILNDLPNLKAYEIFIKREISYELEGEIRKNNDEVKRGNKWRLEILLLSIGNDHEFLKYFKMKLLSSYVKDYYSDEIWKKYVFRIKKINESKNDDLVNMFSDILKATKNSFHSSYDISISLVDQLGLSKRVFEQLFESIYFKESYPTCAQLLTQNGTFDIFKERVIHFKGLNTELEYFRNVINSYGKRDLAVKVEDFLLERGFPLSKEIKHLKTFNDLRIEYQDKLNQESNLMFNKPQFEAKLKSHFDKLGVSGIISTQINSERQSDKIKNDLFNRFGYKKIEERFIFSVSLLFDNRKVSWKECEKKLNDQLFYANFVFTELKKLKNNKNINFDLAPINDKIQKVIDELIVIKTDNLITFNEGGSFSIVSNSSFVIENIHYFIVNENLNLNIDDNFILNTLEYYDFKNNDLNSSNFELLINHVKDQNEIKRAISKNLQKKLIRSIYVKHALYALKHKFENSYEYIKNRLLADTEIYDHDNVLKAYVEADGIGILVQLAKKDINTRTCWSAIKMLMENSAEETICIEKSLEYLSSGEILFIEYASNVLFITNHSAIINYILEDLEKRLNLIFKNNTISFSNYSVIPTKGIHSLQDMFDEVYKQRKKTNYNTAYLNSFFSTYISNLVTEQKMFYEIQALLLEIKKRVEKVEDDDKLYHINALLRDIENAYINSLSKGISFDEALDIIKNIEV